jgi:hypothetical protein
MKWLGISAGPSFKCGLPRRDAIVETSTDSSTRPCDASLVFLVASHTYPKVSVLQKRYRLGEITCSGRARAVNPFLFISEHIRGR